MDNKLSLFLKRKSCCYTLTINISLFFSLHTIRTYNVEIKCHIFYLFIKFTQLDKSLHSSIKNENNIEIQSVHSIRKILGMNPFFPYLLADSLRRNSSYTRTTKT